MCVANQELLEAGKEAVEFLDALYELTDRQQPEPSVLTRLREAVQDTERQLENAGADAPHSSVG